MTMYSLWVKNSAGAGWVRNDEEMSHADKQSDSRFSFREVLDAADYVIGHVDAKSEVNIVPAQSMHDAQSTFDIIRMIDVGQVDSLTLERTLKLACERPPSSPFLSLRQKAKKMSRDAESYCLALLGEIANEVEDEDDLMRLFARACEME